MRVALIAAVLIFGVTACGTGERPFRMVQFCLAGPQEIDAMKGVLRSVASANALPFYDRSADTEAEAESIAEVQKNMPIARPTVNVGTVGPDAMGFSAGNFPEAPSQIVVGFSKGKDATAARRLSDEVVRALARRWHVHEVPNVEQSGAFPLKDCDG
jgi:hypothetical protein